jgi:ABC-type enterochelin transport system substrate-binding protein
MISKLSLLLCAIFAIVLVGCSKSDTNTNGSATTANSNKAAASSTTPASTTASTAGDKIGVPECDEYLTAYDACVNSKVPEAVRAQYKTSFDQVRASWRKLAENPATKGTLAAACKTATEQARTAMKSYGCTF